MGRLIDAESLNGEGLCGLDQNGITDKTCRKCWDREMQEGTDDGESSYHN